MPRSRFDQPTSGWLLRAVLATLTIAGLLAMHGFSTHHGSLMSHDAPSMSASDGSAATFDGASDQSDSAMSDSGPLALLAPTLRGADSEGTALVGSCVVVLTLLILLLRGRCIAGWMGRLQIAQRVAPAALRKYVQMRPTFKLVEISVSRT